MSGVSLVSRAHIRHSFLSKRIMIFSSIVAMKSYATHPNTQTHTSIHTTFTETHTKVIFANNGGEVVINTLIFN